ncbi:hypothetical protein QR680_007408 [Steinernema hermaphroditum]|uniref:Uncharacterized protein n=1 Tax=Steinernema hermaphroditum TaxID=289476 RepID=A0AA39ID30_9BILA|nr:hypothetical protein QR680_007408 [Steinernema hermaphroditum]
MYYMDSVIFRTIEVENRQLLVSHKGDLLGQLKDETDGDPMVKFVACGPKVYCYITKSGKVELKFRC